ncbi:uncharacterized protein LOC121980733 isoform X1 [Zingiber officinale]|uniref:Uncharacterized protein n=1 Tax=Zingiber officinale TaxID=94328 RepID=A0A8J5GI64_ZINOF|nr:uncharacterized protein LOC121980733 isoform X1 [Zingiber officinale]KAG6507012.1 hypothetical protein ZIOFF_032347 [Zingiber officinale]
MEIVLLSDHVFSLSPPLAPLLRHRGRFDPLFHKYRSFPYHRHRSRKPVVVSFSLSGSSGLTPIPSRYGGWDDPDLLDESYRSGKFDSVRNLLASFGINERKHGFLFLLGFLSALAVSRARISSMAILPVSVVIFVAGFSAGMSQASAASGSIWDFDVKIKDVSEFLKDMDEKVSDLGNGLAEGVQSNRIEKSRLKDYVDILKYVRSRIVHAQRTLDDSASVVNVDEQTDFEQGKKSSQKPSRNRRELGMIAFDILQFFGNILQENFTVLKPSQERNAINKVELSEQGVSVVEKTEASDIAASTVISGNGVNLSSKKSVNPNLEKSQEPLRVAEGAAADQNSGSVSDVKKFEDTGDQRYKDDMLPFDEENNPNASFRFKTKKEHYQKMVFRHHYEDAIQNDGHTSMGSNSNQKATKNIDFFKETAESLMLEQKFEVHNKSYLHSDEYHGSNLKDESISSIGSNNQFGNDLSGSGVKTDYPIDGVRKGKIASSFSSTHSTDGDFDQNVQEASELLRQARIYMKSQTDEAALDALLYRSEKLLSVAVHLKPMSLLAVGQLGNAYLLHGELKLKISKQLRALLSKSDVILNEKSTVLRGKKLDTRILSRDNLTSALTDVCEECEELLGKAGRKYRMALTIDGSDIRALYNWGLALSYRAQLIADIGPEAAADADKVYMAAIDKFDAIVTKSNAYAPDALYRWGVALQQRSNLRRNNRGEKLKLLQQAKSLFEDVLYVESNNRLAREALSSCLLELDYHRKW